MTHPLVKLLQNKAYNATIDGASTRLYWADATRDWRVIYWVRGVAKTLYQGVDLDKAVEIFIQHESN